MMRSKLWIMAVCGPGGRLRCGEHRNGAGSVEPGGTACSTSTGTVTVPSGAVAVEDITYTMLNSNDGGNVGIWARDDGFCHVQVWRVSRGHFYAAVAEFGTWTTVAGALSPGQWRP